MDPLTFTTSTEPTDDDTNGGIVGVSFNTNSTSTSSGGCSIC